MEEYCMWAVSPIESSFCFFGRSLHCCSDFKLFLLVYFNNFCFIEYMLNLIFAVRVISMYLQIRVVA